jgi:hypothetical protein
MTSSVTSTETGLEARESGPPGVGPSAGPPARGPAGLTPRQFRRLAFGLWLVAPAVLFDAVLYSSGLTMGALFVAFGWAAFAAAAWQLGRAALAFDLATEDDLEQSIDATRRSELLQEKRSLLKAIKEIEFDHQMGKLDDQDAAEITTTYRARALEIMRLLDENKAIDYKTVVEKELARRLLKTGSPVAKKLPPAPAEEPAASAEEKPAELAAGLCGSCGTQNDTDAVFCKKCATRLSS